MKKISCVIIDDESLARDVVRSFASAFEMLEVAGECKNGVEGLNTIQELKPDLIFLDIQMPDLDGFGMLKELEHDKRPFIIFTTAHDVYAQKAFEVNAIDYLLKPISKERFDVSIQKVLAQINGSHIVEVNRALDSLLETYIQLRGDAGKKQPYIGRMLVKENKRIFFVKTSELTWIEASGDYVKLHVEQRSHLINDSLNNLELKLDPKVFVRIHRSTIVNVECIKEFKSYFNGEYIIHLKTGEALKLSRSYKDKLKDLFGDFQ